MLSYLQEALDLCDTTLAFLDEDDTSEKRRGSPTPYFEL
jgi:hypothetical protein